MDHQSGHYPYPAVRAKKGDHEVASKRTHLNHSTFAVTRMLIFNSNEKCEVLMALKLWDSLCNQNGRIMFAIKRRMEARPDQDFEHMDSCHTHHQLHRHLDQSGRHWEPSCSCPCHF